MSSLPTGPSFHQLDPKTPLITARLFLAGYRDANGNDTIRYWGDCFYQWSRSTAAWIEIEDERIRRLIYRFCEEATITAGRPPNEGSQPFAPTKTKVDQVLDALRAECFLSVAHTPPCWLAPLSVRPPVHDVIPCRNGIVHLPAFVNGEPNYLTAPTPLFFNLRAVDYDFVPEAPPPARWLEFLHSLWPDDEQSIALLQEWFGYCLTADTRMQKILLVVGPKRGGKGTIARVLRALLGLQNVAGPTLSSFATNFGLWPLVGKSLAIISDARLSGKADQAAIVERLLSISGEDALNIDRKYLPVLTTTLPTRLMLLTNELPKFADASGALASRLVILHLTRSFLGEENLDLTSQLLAELSGILHWALEGWTRLRAERRFTAPTSSVEMVHEMERLSSPMAAFVADRCIIGANHTMPVADLYHAWQSWCRDEGRDHPGTAASFGRDLRAAFPAISTCQPRANGLRTRNYQGIRIAPLNTNLGGIDDVI